MRVAGLWKADRWREGLETCVPIAAFGLTLAVVSGAVLFSVSGENYVADPAVRVKALIVAAGLANVFAFRRAMARREGAGPSRAMRLSALLSVAVWVSAIVAGCWIAFTY